ncbi:HAMP domain-containing sensor histidine kinase [Intestinimonas butyriciproducens]|uniref:HAMP domain-containing sensor histidine kinase n=1 Tax=Intestinimonas butyriciproducens TaxID=1297617 RepID=UPI0018AB9FC8|nr:HAMP domain-containing sensor histidine kinase [Intestinimonas butyriciproducens]MDB7818053.1 HAMP domain-containing sensor histidine kinase [Intestinimonas butyriciproducens]MDB7844410.1 HAMP domain-containing sensor histidine kinase [Intestinimonas butyriciproducens]MDB7858891.1 HAMP domain-containing sensor histidine kinase [Intestinimonas butyriciproducens]
MKHRASSLTAHFSLLLLLSGTVAVLVFCCLRFGGGWLLEQYFDGSDFQQQYNERRIQSFQSYVEENDLATTDTAQITRWYKKHPLILMEVYRSNILRYTSAAPEEALDNETEVPYYTWVSYYEVPFADGTAEVVIYADDTYRFFTWLTVLSLGMALLAFLLIFLQGCRRVVRYICQLSVEIQAMEGGDLDVAITFQGNHELTRLAHSLDSMRRAFQEQKEREINIFRANQAMITAMSHDLRTPLTTLQIYTDILRYKKYEPSQLEGYLEKIDAKAAQIKQLSENIFEYSLVPKHQTIELEEPRPFRDVFHDQLSEMAVYLTQQNFSFELELDWPDLNISVSSQYIKRLMDNVLSNLIKYADAEFPVLIATTEKEGGVAILFQNKISSAPLQQEGTHIGLANMKAMMEKMGGECRNNQTGSIFQLELWFPSVPQKIQGGCS